MPLCLGLDADMATDPRLCPRVEDGAAPGAGPWILLLTAEPGQPAQPLSVGSTSVLAAHLTARKTDTPQHRKKHKDRELV